ncbi:LysR family transcriptional regulator [Vibrio ulleungensis]|uniref:LysR family transcriptional regulator n=1 Tax=Vibrio ulleungensis TaxID=2807619 RepID=A0ABS2HF80_9VIBR|nr:LysR family transcriptional regulator [Vibrio ulleungensis]MBM7035689.1 LysR family transcriptional regulator [Vibrio ulleungensis]
MNTPLTLEALHIIDAIDRRGSFTAAAEELDRVPSSLSYQIQKLEQELDIVIYDRSGHRAKLTKAGTLLLQKGRLLLSAANQLVDEACAIANGWELDLTIAYDGIVPVKTFFPLVDALAKKSATQLKFQEEILAGSWESLSEGRADLLVTPVINVDNPQYKMLPIGAIEMVWVAAADHYVHKRSGIFDLEAQRKYRIIAIADTARSKPTKSINILDKQDRLTVSNFSAKVDALSNGLGIGTLPNSVAAPLIERGVLQAISDTPPQTVALGLFWKRDQMGKAKTWLTQQMPKMWPKTL